MESMNDENEGADWRLTMPVWAAMQLIQAKKAWSAGGGVTLDGPILSGRMVDLPSKVWKGSLLPAARIYEVQIMRSDGSVMTMGLWPSDNYARWWGESEEERTEARWPNDDVITGWPDHYIINGDPSMCGCPEHGNVTQNY